MEKHISTGPLDILSEHQWGFLPGRSTVTALITAFDDMLHYMEDGSLDLRKAFDSVPHAPLLRKLKKIGLNQPGFERL